MRIVRYGKIRYWAVIDTIARWYVCVSIVKGLRKWWLLIWELVGCVRHTDTWPLG